MYLPLWLAKAIVKYTSPPPEGWQAAQGGCEGGVCALPGSAEHPNCGTAACCGSCSINRGV